MASNSKLNVAGPSNTSKDWFTTTIYPDKVPTEVDLQYEHEGNNFALYSLESSSKKVHSSKAIPINISSDSKSTESNGSTDRMLEEIVAFARSHKIVHEEVEEEAVHGDEEVEQQAAHQGEGYRWKKGISDAFAKGKTVL
ncbi:hypothetical protein A2U01_0006382, partial [Trifolium medium]|nr:hypothetical protein [Trifolium medium]